MEIVILFLLLIFILYAYNTSKNIKQLEDENEKLKNEIEKYKNQEKIQNTYSNFIKEENNQKNIFNENLKETPKISNEELEKKQKEKQNTSILISGAVLIVLATIVFLMSTWNDISNVLKIILVFILGAVFLGISKIAKIIFKLEKTSNTFFYIAMAYIPICLIFCSSFGLIGNYFSIYGEGRYIYFTLVFIVSSIIYYLYYKKLKTKVLFYGIILSQTSAVILFGLIFEKSLLMINLGLLIYNLILNLLKNKFKNYELLNYFCRVLPYICFISSLAYINFVHIFMLLIIVLLAINFFLYTKIQKNSNIESYLFNICLYFLGIYFSYVFLGLNSINKKQILALIYIIIIYTIEEIFINPRKNKAHLNVLSVYLIFICLQSIQNEKIIVLKPFIILFVEMIILFIGALKSENKERNIYSILSLISFILAGCNIIFLCNLDYTFYLLLGIITLIIVEIINYIKTGISKNLFIVPHIFIIGITLIYFGDVGSKIFDNILNFLLLDVIYIYSLIKYRESEERLVYKYLTYISMCFTLFSISKFLELSFDLVPMSLTIMISMMEQKYKNIKDEFSVSIFSIISFIYLLNYKQPINILLAFLLMGYLIFYNIKNNENKYMRIIPYTGFLVLLNTGISTSMGNYNILISVLTLITITILSIYQKKISVDTIFSGIYLLYLRQLLDNTVISELFVVIWAFSNMYFMNDNRAKDLFKGIGFFGSLLLYEILLSELKLEKYHAFNMVGITIFGIVLFKKILKKYIKDIDNAEYCAYSIIYLISFVTYNNVKDGMIYVAFMIGIIIYSYIQKYGTLFIITLTGVLVNVIALTRSFWFSIPWWLYLLVIGSVLIGFAIKNENDENKNQIKMENFVKKLKNKIEK